MLTAAAPGHLQGYVTGGREAGAAGFLLLAAGQRNRAGWRGGWGGGFELISS